MSISIELNPYDFGVKSKIPYFVGVNKQLFPSLTGYNNPNAVSEIKINEKSTYINPLLRSTFRDSGYFGTFYTRRLPFFPFKGEKIAYSNSDYLTLSNFDYLKLKDCLISPTTSNSSSDSYSFNPRFQSISSPLSSLMSFYIKENPGNSSTSTCKDMAPFIANVTPPDSDYQITPINILIAGFGIRFYFFYENSKMNAKLDFYSPGGSNLSTVSLIKLKFDLSPELFGEISKRKCALGYTRIDYGGTDLSGTWIFLQIELLDKDTDNQTAHSFVGVFIPDKASDPDKGLSDDDIRVVTENSSKVSCTITGKYTDWKEVGEYLKWMRGEKRGYLISSIESQHFPNDRSATVYDNPMVIWYKN